MSDSTASQTNWEPAPSAFQLTGNEAHIWRADLKNAGAVAQTLYPWLAVDEQGRADRFHFQRDRERFVTARAILRTILGFYLEIHPQEVRFAYSDYGKPSPADRFDDSEVAREVNRFQGRSLCFNLSHSGELALYAVCLGREVGIDVEQLRSDFGGREIAERFFSAAEVAELLALDAALQTQAFFDCWTRKEAYVKAIGEGLSRPLDQFDVSLQPGEPARLKRVQGDPDEAARWQMKALAVGSGYASAVVVEGVDCQFKYYHFPAL